MHVTCTFKKIVFVVVGLMRLSFMQLCTYNSALKIEWCISWQTLKNLGRRKTTLFAYWFHSQRATITAF